jgi:hypothetical protein
VVKWQSWGRVTGLEPLAAIPCRAYRATSPAPSGRNRFERLQVELVNTGPHFCPRPPFNRNHRMFSRNAVTIQATDSLIRQNFRRVLGDRHLLHHSPQHYEVMCLKVITVYHCREKFLGMC